MKGNYLIRYIKMLYHKQYARNVVIHEVRGKIKSGDPACAL